MRILVCIKQVPNTTEIKIDPVTNTLKRDGVPSIINPDDKAALEAALTLKDNYGAEVNVLCMGPQQAEIALREALAMGADKAYLATDRAFAGSDTLATSTILAAAARKIGFDLIIAGRQAIDGDTAQVGPQISEHLNLPQITYVNDIKLEGESLIVRRQFEDRYQLLKVKTPVLLTVLSTMNKPRYMSVNGIIDQQDREIEYIRFDDIDVSLDNIGLKGSPTKVKATFNKQLDTSREKLELDPAEAAKVIAKALSEKHFI
jgi:electron transfer flavoprotein beta subunit